MAQDLEAFREYLIENERSENTISSYTDSVKQFFSMFTDVSKKNMIEFKQRKIAEGSPKTAASRCIAMNQYCEFIGVPECKVKSIKINIERLINISRR